MTAAVLLLALCWGGFQAPVRYASAADRAVLVRDLDGDGAPEILASGNQVDELSAFSLLPNRGDGTFGPEQLVPSAFGEQVQDVADLNGDRIPDLLVSNYWMNGIAVQLGKGGLRFDPETPYGTATHGGPSLIADFDRDGKPDVISFSFGSGNPVRVHFFRGMGDGTLGPKTTFDSQFVIADWPSLRTTGGALEILVSEHSGHLGLFRYADGQFTSTTIAAGPGFARASTFADGTGDGVADIVEVEDMESPNEPIFVTIGNERRQLAQPRKVSFPIVVRAGDVDRDGHLDPVGADFSAASVYFYRGD